MTTVYMDVAIFPLFHEPKRAPQFSPYIAGQKRMNIRKMTAPDHQKIKTYVWIYEKGE